MEEGCCCGKKQEGEELMVFKKGNPPGNTRTVLGIRTSAPFEFLFSRLTMEEKVCQWAEKWVNPAE